MQAQAQLALASAEPIGTEEVEVFVQLTIRILLLAMDSVQRVKHSIGLLSVAAMREIRVSGCTTKCIFRPVGE